MEHKTNGLCKQKIAKFMLQKNKTKWCFLCENLLPTSTTTFSFVFFFVLSFFTFTSSSRVQYLTNSWLPTKFYSTSVTQKSRWKDYIQRVVMKVCSCCKDDQTFYMMLWCTNILLHVKTLVLLNSDFLPHNRYSTQNGKISASLAL